MRPVPEQGVLKWVDQLNVMTTFTSAITHAEILQGIFILPDGKRRDNLYQNAQNMFELFDERILPFSTKTAKIYAAVVTERQRLGCPIHFQDAQIAAISIENQCVLATRNIKDFDMIKGLECANPWAQQQ